MKNNRNVPWRISSIFVSKAEQSTRASWFRSKILVPQTKEQNIFNEPYTIHEKETNYQKYVFIKISTNSADIGPGI